MKHILKYKYMQNTFPILTNPFEQNKCSSSFFICSNRIYVKHYLVYIGITHLSFCLSCLCYLFFSFTE